MTSLLIGRDRRKARLAMSFCVRLLWTALVRYLAAWHHSVYGSRW